MPRPLYLFIEEIADHRPDGDDGHKDGYFFKAGFGDGSYDISSDKELQSQQQVAAQVDAYLLQWYRPLIFPEESPLGADEFDEPQDNAPEHNKDTYRTYPQGNIFKYLHQNIHAAQLYNRLRVF